MKAIQTAKTLAVLSFILLFAASCSTTKVISSWSVSSPPQGAMDKVLVLAVMQNMQHKDEIEQAMASELNNSGVTAVTATSLFGPRGFRGFTEEQITDRLKGSDFTSVMIVSLVDREKERNYVPGRYFTSRRIVGFSRYFRRYLVVYDRMYTPGYFTTRTNYVLGADIFTLNEDDELIYSAQTRSFDPANARSLATGFARAIMGELRSKGIVR